MRFYKKEHKALIRQLGYNPDHDYVTDDELCDLWQDVTDYLQKAGFKYVGNEPVPTEVGLLCEEIADYIYDESVEQIGDDNGLI
jgi:hypothetical protein